MMELLELFRVFVIIGATAFGGGYTIIPVLERDIIKKRSWITMDEVLDFYTIAQITPGVIAVNIATFTGYKRKGVLGGIAATIGLILPGVCLMLFISIFIKRFAENPVVQHAFTGIRIAVCALILSTTIKLIKSFFRDYRAIIIFIIAFALSVLFYISPVFIILGAGFTGMFLFLPVFDLKKNKAGSENEK
jgi:chromate transporter